MSPGGAVAADVVVVGAGPAGSSFAAAAASAGFRVLLLDRQRFPRPKPCGDCVSPAAAAELERMGVLPAVLREEHTRLDGWTIIPPAGGGTSFQGSFPLSETGVGVTRQRLDAVLLEHARSAGAAVRCGVRVTDLVRGRAGGVAGVRTTDGEELPARLVVGADGLRSVVVRRLGLVRRSPRVRKLALSAHVGGVEGLERRGELHVLPGATVGLAPVGGGAANLTVVIQGAEAAGVAGDREGFYDRFVARLPRLRGAVRLDEVRATGPFDWPVRSAVADGALLVGDAAGYFDPFTGQGIFRALRGAALAAAVAIPALQAGDLTAQRLASYDRARWRAFAPGTGLQRVIEQVITRQRLFDLVASRLRRRPQVADALVAVTGDLRPVRSLLSPRLVAALVR